MTPFFLNSLSISFYLPPFRNPPKITCKQKVISLFFPFYSSSSSTINNKQKKRWMPINTWIQRKLTFSSSSSSSPSLFFGLFKLAMNESRLKTNSSFASEVTIPTHQHTQHRKSQNYTPSVYTEKSATIAAEQSRFKSTLISIRKVSWALFVKYWFLLGLLVAIVLAILFPNVARKGGYIRAEWTIKWGKKAFFFSPF